MNNSVLIDVKFDICFIVQRTSVPMHLDASSEAASCSALRMLLCLIVWEEEEDCADMLNIPLPHLYSKEYAYLCIEFKSGKI